MDNEAIGAFPRLQAFLDRLDAARETYRLDRIRPNSIMVEVFQPRVHWEVGSLSMARWRPRGMRRSKTSMARRPAR